MGLHATASAYHAVYKIVYKLGGSAVNDLVQISDHAVARGVIATSNSEGGQTKWHHCGGSCLTIQFCN
jgi:hypothetical protein